MLSRNQEWREARTQKASLIPDRSPSGRYRTSTGQTYADRHGMGGALIERRRISPGPLSREPPALGTQGRLGPCPTSSRPCSPSCLASWRRFPVIAREGTSEVLQGSLCHPC